MVVYWPQPVRVTRLNIIHRIPVEDIYGGRFVLEFGFKV